MSTTRRRSIPGNERSLLAAFSEEGGTPPPVAFPDVLVPVPQTVLTLLEESQPADTVPNSVNTPSLEDRKEDDAEGCSAEGLRIGWSPRSQDVHLQNPDENQGKKEDQ